MKKKKLYELAKFSFSKSKNGNLLMLQSADVRRKANKLPFEIKRVLVLTSLNKMRRGGHTHHKTNQILFALSGCCTVDLDNGYEKTTVKLSKFNSGIFLYPYTWHVMRDFAKGTILLVLADSEYDEKDYIRNYKQFLKCIEND